MQLHRNALVFLAPENRKRKKYKEIVMQTYKNKIFFNNFIKEKNLKKIIKVFFDSIGSHMFIC